MLRTRIITAVIGIPLLLGLLYIGGLAWTLLFALMAFLALYEYLQMMKTRGCKPPILSAYLLLYVLMFLEQLAIYWLPLLLATILFMVIEFVLVYPQRSLDDLALGFLGAFYIGFLLSFALALQQLDQPFIYITLVFILTWASDIGGYLFGRLWGKKKLTPQLSPNKTWAGAIGGVFLTLLLALAFVLYLDLPGLTIGEVLGLAWLGSLAAQFGDLFASAMKRYFGVKDSGHIIPGHGGVLDRFDSFMLVLPVVYYFLFFLG